MTRELIITGQHADLAADTDITLEYTGNLFGDIGKIQLSHSYTVKLPKTTRNARILDDPGNPAHESSEVRVYLSVQYIRNGISLIKDAQAYLVGVTDEHYEVVLVWNTMPALSAWLEQKLMLSELTGLPTLEWVGSDGVPAYGNDDNVLFARYNSGLNGHIYPQVNAATHPAIRLSYLLDQIFTEAGIRYSIESDTVLDALENTVLLIAPKHAPSLQMELDAGSVTDSVQVGLDSSGFGILKASSWTNGWDGPVTETTTGTLHTVNVSEGSPKHRIIINLMTSDSLANNGCIFVQGIKTREGVSTAQTIATYRFTADASGVSHCSIDEELDLQDWDTYRFTFSESYNYLAHTFSRHDTSLPMLAVLPVHDTIVIEHQNLFPAAHNMPEISQTDFVKGIMALFGIVPVIEDGVLALYSYDNLLNTASTNVKDWTERLSGQATNTAFSLSHLGQRNVIAYEKEEDERLGFDPDAVIVTEDATIKAEVELAKLPFAASQGSSAVHYEVSYEDGEWTVSDKDLQPRIFEVVYGLDGWMLEFPRRLMGENLVDTYYSGYQTLVKAPVALTVNVRLTEIDLTTLDFTRPIYFEQFGRYYLLKSVQTSDSYECKVELIQIP